MRLPTLHEMLQTRAAVAKSNDFGLWGTKRIGSENAKCLIAICGLVHENQLNALAPMWVLMQHPDLLRDDTQVALVLARHQEAGSVSRVPTRPFMGFPFEERINALIKAFGIIKQPFAAVDIQENSRPKLPDGWVMGVMGVADQLCETAPSSLRIKNITQGQLKATGTIPFGAAAFDCPTIQILTHPHTKPGGICAAVKSALAVLGGLQCLSDAVEMVHERAPQRVLNVCGAITVPDNTQAYTIDSPFIQGYATVSTGQVVARSTNGKIEVRSPADGILCLGPEGPAIPAGQKEPLFYLAKKEDPRHRTVRYPAWLDGVK